MLKDDRGHVVYVGKSVNIRQRVRQHLRPSGTAGGTAQPRLRKRLRYIADVEAIETDSELAALFLESKLVKRYLPDANRLLRDYRDYPFLKIDYSDAFPRIEATRERPTAGAEYFGPFRRAKAVVRAAIVLSEELGLRQCKGPITGEQAPCVLLELKKCLGPCVGAVSREEYRAAAGRASETLRGKDDSLQRSLEARRDVLAEELRFEEAAQVRDGLQELSTVVVAQQRLHAFAERNAALVTRDPHTGAARIFLVRAGRVARDLSFPNGAAVTGLEGLLRELYLTPDDRPVDREDLDDLVILSGWARRHEADTVEVPIDPGALNTAAQAIHQVMTQSLVTAG